MKETVYTYRKVCRYAQNKQIQEKSLPVCAPADPFNRLIFDEAVIDFHRRGKGVQARNIDPKIPHEIFLPRRIILLSTLELIGALGFQLP